MDNKLIVTYVLDTLISQYYHVYNTLLVAYMYIYNVSYFMIVLLLTVWFLPLRIFDNFFFKIFISMLIANRILTLCSVCILGISHLSVQKKPRSWAEQSDHALIYCVQPPTLEHTDQYWLSVRYSFLQNLIFTFLATSVWL